MASRAIARATSTSPATRFRRTFRPPPTRFEPKWGGGIDLFLTKLKPGIPGPGGLQSSTYIGQRGVYSPTALTLGRDGTIYLVGFGGLGLPSTSDALQGYGGGLSDGFIMVLSK